MARMAARSAWPLRYQVVDEEGLGHLPLRPCHRVSRLRPKNLEQAARLTIVSTALILYFTIPRPPSFSFYEPQPFTVDNSTVLFSRVPTNFSFTGNLNLLGQYDGLSAGYGRRELTLCSGYFRRVPANSLQ